MKNTLEILRPIFGAKPTQLTTGMVFLSSTGTHLYMSANNGELYACIKTEAQYGEWEAVVSGSRLLNAMKSAAGEVRLFVKDKSLHLESRGMKARFSCGDPSELPALPFFEGELSKLNSDELAIAIDQTLPFVAHDTSRPALCGIHFDDNTVVATTGRMLGCRKINTQLKSDATISEEAARLLKSLKGEVQIGFSGNSFKAQSDTVQIVGAVLADKFPANWKGLLPAAKECPIRITVEREELEAALPAVSSVNIIQGRNIVKLTAGIKQVTLSAEVDEQHVERFLEAEVTQPFETGFDAGYMTALLGAMRARDITFLIRDNISAILLQENDFQAVLWPIRTN